MDGISEERFREVFDLVEPYIERRYGVPVIITDVPSPFTGDLDGKKIHIDYDIDLEDAVFLIAHLFGHTVQWNLVAESRDINQVVQAAPTEENLAKLEAYEREACAYSLQLFHEAGVHDLDQWMADFATCDFRYLRHFFSTGEKRPFRSFWQQGSPKIAPIPIPDFSPQRWVTRLAGIVV